MTTREELFDSLYDLARYMVDCDMNSGDCPDPFKASGECEWGNCELTSELRVRDLPDDDETIVHVRDLYRAAWQETLEGKR